MLLAERFSLYFCGVSYFIQNWWAVVTARFVRALFLSVILFSFVFGCSSSGKAPQSGTAADINSRKQQADELIAAGSYEAAVTVLAPLVSSETKDSQIYFMIANAQWKLSSYDDAVANFENGLRIDYSDGVAHLDFGEMLMEMGKVGRALTEFEFAIQFGEDESALAHYNYGLALFDFGRTDKALAEWGIAQTLDKSNAKYAEALGIGLTGRDDRKALEYFETAEELGANEPSFHNNYGLLLIRLGMFRRAETEFLRASELKPEDDDYRLNQAVAHLRAGDFAGAVPILEQLIARDATNPTYQIYLGRAYYEQERHQDCVDLLEPWLQNIQPAVGDDDRGPDPVRLSDAHDALAMSLRGIGALDRAVVFSASSVEFDPDNPVRLNNYGVILAESGRIDEAKAQWRKVLDIEPDNAVAKQNLSAVGG